MQKQVIDLAHARSGGTGTVIDVIGGHGIMMRLETLGIRIGVKIIKLSGQFARGPVTIQVGNTQAAIGFGMAQKIMIEIE